MHKFMRAIGFSEYTDRKKIKELIRMSVTGADERAYTLNEEGVMLGEFCKNYADGMGIAVCGAFDEEDDKFTYEYYYPYVRGTGVTSYEEVTIERLANREAWRYCRHQSIKLRL